MKVRKAFFYPRDLLMKWTGHRHPYEPPKGDIYIGSGNFIKQGKHQLKLLIELASLKPESNVLDIGSGIGRTAAALTEYLSREARYEGFDVVKKGVDWCNQTIHRDFPNFKFTFIPLHNDLYNEDKGVAESYTFPLENAQFDVIFLFSVFTHMLPHEIDHYLHEINRLLKPGGKCLATFFLVPEERLNHYIRKNKFRFPFPRQGYLLMNQKVQSANVALWESTFLEMTENAGLRCTYKGEGYWKDTISKKQAVDFQDIVILAKI